MAEKLYSALDALRPKEFSEIPLDELNIFVRDVFYQAELIANSVPPPPGGSESASSSLTLTVPNAAASAKDVVHSEARPPPPVEQHSSLQKCWGKPIKISQRDNSLNISVYKMAGHDRHGAWFSRRSVHEGLGFTRWKRAMQREFVESLAVKGGPGAGSVRGIGADKRLMRTTVEGIGRVEVYQLSAQFPGPVAPREFVTLLLTSDSALTEKSAPPQAGKERVRARIPRHYIVVSIPLEHPDAPPRNGMVRGQYESVELIREVPVAPVKTRSTTDLLSMGGNGNDRDRSRSRARSMTISFAESRGDDAKGEEIDRDDGSSHDAEMNPVEWIMVTRSDPGGGIPRFMVERNTPASITADAVKFVDWATKAGRALDQDEEADEQEEPRHSVEQVDSRTSESAGHEEQGEQKANGPHAAAAGDQHQERSTFEPSAPGGTSLIESLTSVVQTGIAHYAPQVVSDNIPSARPHHRRSVSSSSTSSTVSSVSSFASAHQFQTAKEWPDAASSSSTAAAGEHARMSKSSLGFSSPTGSTASVHRKNKSAQEREIEKLAARRAELESRFQKQQQERQTKSSELTERQAREQEKARARTEREMRKATERHAKEVRKLEQQREKKARKLEERRRREADKDAVAKANRERDEARQRADRLETENRELHDQVGALQREVTVLVREMGRVEGGAAVLKSMRDEIGPAVTLSPRVASGKSGKSGELKASKNTESSGKKSHEEAAKG